MGKIAVKQVPPDVAKGVRDVNDGVKKLDHPLYVVEERKGTGKATCRQCDKPIKEGERSLYFHYAPEDDNTWIRQRGSIHAEDCGGGANMYTKCPACLHQYPRSEWTDHWTKERKKRQRAAGKAEIDWDRCERCKGGGKLATGQKCFDCKGSGVLTPGQANSNPSRVASDKAQYIVCGDCEGKGCANCKNAGMFLDHVPEGNFDDYSQDLDRRCLRCHNLPEEHRQWWGWDAMEDEGELPEDIKEWRESKVAAKEKGVWDQRWEDLAAQGLNRDQAKSVYNMLENARAHTTLTQAQQSRAMMNKNFPPADDEWKTCPQCQGSAKIPNPRFNPPGPREDYQACETCAGTGQSLGWGGDRCLHCKGSGLQGKRPGPKNPAPFLKCPRCAGIGKTAQMKKKPQMGLDPNTQPGNTTSMGDTSTPGNMGNETTMGDSPSNGFTPRVDPASENKGQQMMSDDLDTEARKLQKGLKGLDQFAGSSFDRVSHVLFARFKNMAIDRTWMVGQENQWRQYNKDKADHDAQRGPEWDQYRSDVVQHGKDMDAWNEAQKDPSPYMACTRCEGKGSDRRDNRCGYCKGSGLTEYEPDSPPRPPYQPYSPSPPVSPSVGTATGIRFDPKLESAHTKEVGKYYPPIEDKECHWCKGVGTRRKGWGDNPDEQQECYTCKGSGRETYADSRDTFESYLSNYTGKKQIAPLMRNTGVHEDAEHYHVKLHDTDILSFHKKKPEVSIDWGSGNYWATQVTKERTSAYLPRGWSVGNQETSPGDRNLVVETPHHSYYMRQGITLNTDTGEALDPADQQRELHQCKECYRVREADEMAKHQARHDAYRAGYEKSKYRKCGDCNGSGTTEPWTTTCRTCKGAGADRDGTWCPDCKATGIVFHEGADASKGWENGEHVIPNPDQCGTCKGEGQLEKRRPIGL